jgi:xanthine phosphoribosyltransferase
MKNMALKILRDRILADGRSLKGVILKVDRFINHQMDPYLMKQVAVEFIRRFSDLKVNKIVTVEASGIAPSVMLGYLMELPVVFAKKRQPSTMGDAYVTTVHSFTKGSDCQLMISREYLTPDDHVLFVDDFLAYGNAGMAILDLSRQAGATVEGMGFVIEKEMLRGRELLQAEGVRRIESLAIVDSLENDQIHIKDD